MKPATNFLIEALVERGYRVTTARRQLCEALISQKDPVTIQTLVKLVDADEASVYRTVHVLKKEGLLEEISVHNDVSRYSTAIHHHHHVVCRNCHTIAHVPCTGRIPSISHPDFDHVDNHEVTYYGVCVQCR